MVGILPLENHTKNTRRNNRNEKPPRDKPQGIEKHQGLKLSLLDLNAVTDFMHEIAAAGTSRPSPIMMGPTPTIKMIQKKFQCR
jgi:hypothetical protein